MYRPSSTHRVPAHMYMHEELVMHNRRRKYIAIKSEEFDEMLRHVRDSRAMFRASLLLSIVNIMIITSILVLNLCDRM